MAKSHGIYGFAFYYYWFSGKRLLEKPLDIYLNNKSLNFPFLLIWANENWTRNWNGKNGEILMKQEYRDKDPELFIKDIKKYIIDFRYIKINNKPIIGLYEPFKIPKLNKTIKIWREKSKEYGIGKIFILICVNRNSIKKIQNLKIFDGAYDFPPRNNIDKIFIKFKKTFLYSELLYKNIYLNKIINTKKIPIYRGSMLEWDNCPRIKICNIFDNYSPEQFYMINKIIVKWTQNNYRKENRFIFINAWNEWGEGSYLKPDDKFGYSSINSLSKALFNLSFIKTKNLSSFNNTSKILVQAHIHNLNLNLIKNIIKFTNNIPVKFDIFISLSKVPNKVFENYIKIKSKAFRFKFQVFPNEGNDILPFFLQVKNYINKYKYCCHIYTKKLLNINFGNQFRNYLLNTVFNKLK